MNHKNPILLLVLGLLTLLGLTQMIPHQVLAQAQEKIVQAYNTMSGLALANPNLANNVVVVQGLATSSDGQGGVFAYDPTSSVSTNSTNAFAPSTGTGRWTRQFGSSLKTEVGKFTSAGDGTITNAFPVAFSAAPIVVTTPVNNSTPTNTVLTITSSNFTATVGANGVVVNWAAFGLP